MAYKQLGAGVSQSPQAVVPSGGRYTAEDHSWESLVFQHNQPVMDWELNLQNEITGPYGLGQHIRQTLASGFLSGDFYESGGIGSSFSFPAASPGNENMFSIAAADLVVNGWNVRFEFSDIDTIGWNNIELSAPPSTGTRTDVVILEIWRALVSPGSGTNKSPTGKILRHGNAKAPDVTGNQNLADDIIDPVYAQLTQARVQVQYRYRVIPSWDISAYPEVPDAAVANTVPYLSGSDVNGAASIYSYSRVDDDPGLWRAGVGNSTSSSILGTVDGYIYAIPICAVFRRNSTAFDRSTNLNGGALIVSGTSDRPDGLFSDQIVASDVKDLRKGVTTNFQDSLMDNFQYLLHNELATEHEITLDSCSGTAVFTHNTLGTGDRQPDAVRIYFSDRATTETVVCHVQLTVAPFTQCDLDTSALPVYWYGDVDLDSYKPSGTSILEVRKVRMRIADISEEVDGLDSGNGKIYVSSISLTSTHATLYLQEDVLYTGPIDVFVELAIGYPKACGLDRTPSESIDLWIPTGLASWADPSTIYALSDITRKRLDGAYWSIDNAHRELRLTFKEPSNTETAYASPTGDYVMFPYMLDGSGVTINDGINPPYVTTDYVSYVSYTRIELDPTVPANTPVQITFGALIPAPPIPLVPDSNYDVFYKSPATQSVAVPSGTYQIKLRHRSSFGVLSIATAGSASPSDLSWPSVTGFSQIPMADLGTDSDIDSPAEVQLSTTSPPSSGVAYVPFSFSYLNSNEVILKTASDTTQDADGRNFWPKVDDPVAFYGSIGLESDVLRRVMYPALMEVVSTDTDIVRPGTLMLVVFTSVDVGSQPSISVSTTASLGCVALYRTRGNLINPRKLTQ